MIEFEIVNYPRPDCEFCGNHRDGMIHVTDNMGGNMDKWICVICANGLCEALSKKKENKS